MNVVRNHHWHCSCGLIRWLKLLLCIGLEQKDKSNKLPEVWTMANPTTSTYGHSPAEPMREAASQAGERAKEAAAGVGAKAREAASAVGELVSSAASAVGSTVSKSADRMTSATGSGVRHLGETIKEKGPHSGMFGGASRAVGDTLEEGGQYLEKAGLSGMFEDCTELIRRNPVPAILLGVGLGFLLGRTLRS
jgi:hypothetical protein